MLRQDWFSDGSRDDRLVQLGIWHRAHPVETSRRVARLAPERPIVLLPPTPRDPAAARRGHADAPAAPRRGVS